MLQPVKAVHPSHVRFSPDDELLFLFRVRMGNRKEVLRCLQYAGAEVKVLLNTARTRWGDTALHIAYRRRNLDMVKLLLQYGADPAELNDRDQPAIPATDTVLETLNF